MSTSGSSKYALIDQLAERQRKGERPSVQEYVERHPELADEIRDVFPALVEMEGVEPERAASSVPAPVPARERVGDYRIVREIGQGGMGVVYEAEQISLGRRVALKVLPAHVARDERALERFQREARAAAKLHHTNIVPVFEVGQDGDTFYYAMQLIHGQPLDQVIDELRRLRGPDQADRPRAAAVSRAAEQLLTGQFEPLRPATEETPPQPADSSSAVLPGRTELSAASDDPRHYFRSVARVGQQAASALAYAHARGVVHRDIKPSNLLLDCTGTVWVADFGLAKGDESNLTASNEVVGTLRYLAPERFRHQCDARADVYALGLTLYELLTLRSAFGGDQAGVIDAILHRDPPLPRSADARIPVDLETIVLKCLRKEPGQRYASAAALADDLDRWLRGEPIVARPVGRLERAAKWMRRNPAVTALVAAVVLALVTGTLFSTVFAVRADRERQRAEEKAEEAETNARLARSHLYAAHLNLVQNAWEAGRVTLAKEYLARQAPHEGEEGLHNFEWHYWQRQLSAPLLRLRSESELFTTVAFSPDGRFLATATVVRKEPPVVGIPSDLPGEISLWDSVTGQKLKRFTGHEGPVYRVRFSPDGRRLAAVGTAWGENADGTPSHGVFIWDVVSGNRLLSLPASSLFGVKVLAFHPAGRLLVTAHDLQLRLWDTVDGKLIRTFSEKTLDRGSAVSFSPDGSRLVATGDETVAWETETGRLLWKQRRGWGMPAFSPDGRRIAVWLSEGHGPGSASTVCLLDAETGEQRMAWQEARRVTALAFSPDGTQLATGESDTTLRLWSVGNSHAEPSLVLRGHGSAVHDLAFSPDGRRLASAAGRFGEGGEVLVWDAIQGQQAATFTSPLLPKLFDESCWVLLPDGRLAAGHDRVRLFDLRTGLVVWQTRSDLFKALRFAHIQALAFSRDARWVAAAGGHPLGEAGEGAVWDARTGEERIRFTGKHTFAGLAFDTKRNRLLVSDEKSIRAWDVSSWRESRGLSLQARGLACSGDGRFLVLQKELGIQVWNLEEDRLVFEVPGNAENGTHFAFSPDGQRLAVVGTERFAGVYALPEGKKLFNLAGTRTGAISVTFSPDGRRIATAEPGRRWRLWDAQTSQPLLSLQPPWGDLDVSWLGFTPDGLGLVGGGQLERFYVWDVRPDRGSVRDEREASSLVLLLRRQALQQDEILDAIRRDVTITEGVRSRALQLATAYPEDRQRLASVASAVAFRRGRPQEAYHRALRCLERAFALGQPRNDLAFAHCVLLHRCGKHVEAIEVLMAAKEVKKLDPGWLGLLARAQNGAGRGEEARRTLALMRKEIEKQGPQDPNFREALREAQRVIEGPMAGKP